ncbi:MAG: hypothetical protein QOJ05_1779 [Verrucomicrobiota bacterium]
MSHWIAQNNASTEKSHAREDALDDARDRVGIDGGPSFRRSEREKRGDSGAKANQGVGPQSGRFAMQLAIQTENRSKEQRGPKTQHGLFISSQHDPNIEPETLGPMQAFSERLNV